jgi:hypothetical protein
MPRPANMESGEAVRYWRYTFVLVTICFSIWLPSASQANWQNTLWDMSLEDLFAAREHLVRTSPQEQHGETIAILGAPLARG